MKFDLIHDKNRLNAKIRMNFVLISLKSVFFRVQQIE